MVKIEGKLCPEHAALAQQRRLKFGKPKIEDVLFAVLVIFALVWGALMFGLGRQLKREKPKPVVATVEVPAGVAELENSLNQLVKGHPIEQMVPQIAKQDPRVAAYLVAIAKKESNWGKRTPKKDGRECFNYWGYRGPEDPTNSGYSCFENRRQAVAAVGKRIQGLIDMNIDTPNEMVVWKCGWTCREHDPESVRKWIADVGHYYRKIYN